MKKNKILKLSTGFAGAALLFLGLAMPALAATTTGLSVNASATTNTTEVLSKVIARSDTAISARIDALNKRLARINAMQKVSDAEKASATAEVQTQISDLTALKVKIDADTDGATARADAKTITGDYRIYALIIPQMSIIASADRISTLVGIATTLQTKLQTRITDAQNAGKNVTALQAAMTDMTAKLSDATTQGQNANTGVASLSPDQGNATVAASNKTALVASHADIMAGVTDLQAARKDIATIVAGLKALGTIKASSSTSATTTVQ